ncbi:MAG: nitrous oxide-stimulated promoter family protein, partial [Deltaproteobacteria bacterium]|nr:nitrous oxide-stimulated promoter family protein [Deltaproteobacteria bacterium]
MREYKTKTLIKDIDVLKMFFEIYCSKRHSEKGKSVIKGKGLLEKFSFDGLILCTECEKQFIYSVTKRIMCPYDPKPECKKCPSMCYSSENRMFMRDVMRFSGKYLIFSGRFDLIFK